MTERLQQLIDAIIEKTEGSIAEFLNEGLKEALLYGASLDDMRIEHHERPEGRLMELWHRDKLLATAEVNVSHDGIKVTTRKPVNEPIE